ncbi:MAG: hypothetical protein V4664_00685 [Patescibacteria group bacterium]
MYKVKTILLVFAQSRSGHHAVIDWMFNQYDDNKLFFNYNVVSNLDPLFKSRVQYYLNDKRYYRVISNSWIKSGLVEKKLKEFSLETLENVDFIENIDKNLLILNYEDINPDDIDKMFSSTKEIFPEAKIYKVIVLRDLLNLVASKIKFAIQLTQKDIINHSQKVTDTVNLWKAYCKYVLNNKGVVHIVYNKWFSDDGYREDLLDIIKSDKRDMAIPSLSTFGGGSSFDGYKHSLSAKEMKVLERWKEYQDIPSFMNLCYGEDIKYYTGILFGKAIYSKNT